MKKTKAKTGDVAARAAAVALENVRLRKRLDGMEDVLNALSARVASLEAGPQYNHYPPKHGGDMPWRWPQCGEWHDSSVPYWMRGPGITATTTWPWH
jgi:hypothetical protein